MFETMKADRSRINRVGLCPRLAPIPLSQNRKEGKRYDEEPRVDE